MRIIIATDAWKPQVNGVVRTYENLRRELEAGGHSVQFLTPLDFPTVPCPGYPEIRLALPRPSVIARVLAESDAAHVHIATEGPIGWVTRAICRRRGIRFTTAFHTRFAEYVTAYTGIPSWVGYAYQRYFHRPAIATLVATRSLKDDLQRRGFRRLMLWARGVETAQFYPRDDAAVVRHRPRFLYVGRISREKNIEAFLELDLPGDKLLVGDGPHLASLRKRFPKALFVGRLSGDDLARAYAEADVFVFPSRTDTFGLVLLEAMASGLPVAAYPVTGPIDVVKQGLTGYLSEDLAGACIKALSLDRAQIREQALGLDWSRVANLFLENIQTARRVHGVERRIVRSKRKAAGLKPSAKPLV